VFVGDDLPELCADLVAALAALPVYEFAHGVVVGTGCGLLKAVNVNANSNDSSNAK
jgi:hypothetical protein